MASIFRRPKLSKYWYADFRDRNGRLRQVATKELDRERATSIAKHFELIAKRAKTVDHIRKITENLIEEFYGEHEVKAISLSKYASEWLTMKEPTVSPTTFFCEKEKRYQAIDLPE